MVEENQRQEIIPFMFMRSEYTLLRVSLHGIQYALHVVLFHFYVEHFHELPHHFLCFCDQLFVSHTW